MSNLFAFGDKVIGGGESSQSDGHIIQNPSGTAMPTQPNLQFADANVENDSTNNATVVRNFVDIDWDDWQEVDDNDDTYYRVKDAPLVDGNVEVDLMKKLWENSDPSQSFISQTITFPSADYDMLRIYYNESVGGRYNSVEIPKGLNGALTFSAIGGTNSTYIENRSFTRNSDTSYTFGSGQYTLNDGSLVTDNSVLIPIAVYGIKQKVTISLSAIISSISTSAENCMMPDGVTSVADVIDNLTSFEENVEEEIGTILTYKVYRRYISQSVSLPYQAWGTVLTPTQLTNYGIQPARILNSTLGVHYGNAFYQSSSFLGVMCDTTNGLRVSQNMIDSTINALVRGFIIYCR